MGRLWNQAARSPENGNCRFLRGNPVLAAACSALLFGLSTPAAKILLADIPPIGLAGLLYIGAFLGIGIFAGIRRLFCLFSDREPKREYSPITLTDVPWLAGAIAAGGVAGPILLMIGLSRTTGFSASLLLNLEAVATALLASLFFRGKRREKNLAGSGSHDGGRSSHDNKSCGRPERRTGGASPHRSRDDLLGRRQQHDT